MPFQEKLPDWHAEGVEPPESKRNTGWEPGERPPAEYWNWQMNRTYKALQELQQKAAEKADVGDMSTVPTTSKTVAGAITELFTSVSDGKALVAGAITDKGVPTSPSDTFAQMAANIEAIPVGPDTSDATATAADILAGKVAYGAGDQRLVGTMPNRGAVNITPGPSPQSIPAGYHNGSGQVAAVVFDPSKVLEGTTIAGTAGTMPNRTGHVTGQSISRSGTTLRIRPQPGYYPGDSGNSVAWDDPNWVAENIRQGVSIFGLEGALVGKKFASGTATFNSSGILVVSGLAFEPEIVIGIGSNVPAIRFWLIKSVPVKVLFGVGSSFGSSSNFNEYFSITSDGFTINRADVANRNVDWWAWG